MAILPRIFPDGSGEEAKCIAKMSLPIIAASCLSVTMNVVDVSMLYEHCRQINLYFRLPWWGIWVKLSWLLLDWQI